MKLIIDIADFVYDSVLFGETDYKEHICNAIRNGTPIPDNATNGDIVQMMFPTADISLNDSCFEGVVNKYGFDMKWWNAPYQKGGKE